jgi:hypothetical protein
VAAQSIAAQQKCIQGNAGKQQLVGRRVGRSIPLGIPKDGQCSLWRYYISAYFDRCASAPVIAQPGSFSSDYEVERL